MGMLNIATNISILQKKRHIEIKKTLPIDLLNRRGIISILSIGKTGGSSTVPCSFENGSFCH